MFGTVTSVEAHRMGSELTADAAISDTVLAVDFTADFSEEGGTLEIAGATLDYVTVDPDAETVTLAAPLAVAAETSEPVLVVPAGEVGVEWVAHVATDEGDTIHATIPTALIGYFPEGTYDEPVTVELVLRSGRYEVANQPIRDATFDGAAVWNPYVSRRASAVSIPNGAGVWTAVTGWTDSVVQGVVVESDSSVTITYPGFYVLHVSPSFATSATGTRGARIKVGGLVVAYMAIPADPAGTTDVPITAHRVLEEGANITIEVSQTSGAALSLVAGDGISPFSIYRVSV